MRPGDAETSRQLRELCHDLIGSAATIKLLAEASRQGDSSDHSEQQNYMVISAEATKIFTICGHVLGRPRSHKAVRLDHLIEQQVRSVRAVHKTTVELTAAEVHGDMDAAVFLRVVGNLLSNACQAAGPSGLVRVTLTGDGGGARVCVDDSGPGFIAGRGDRACHGLQIIWSLVLGSGGTVQMSVSELGGLRVAVTFPAMSGESAARALGKDPRAETERDVAGRTS